MNHRPYWLVLFTFLLTACAASIQSTPTPMPTATQSPAQSTAVAVKNTRDAIDAFAISGLAVEDLKTESLNQDWFPGTIEALSFQTCATCKRSYVLRFNRAENFNRALDDYEFVGGFYTYSNTPNRLIILLAKDMDINKANRYGAAIGAGQTY